MSKLHPLTAKATHYITIRGELGNNLTQEEWDFAESELYATGTEVLDRLLDASDFYTVDAAYAALISSEEAARFHATLPEYTTIYVGVLGESSNSDLQAWLLGGAPRSGLI